MTASNPRSYRNAVRVHAERFSPAWTAPRLGAPVRLARASSRLEAAAARGVRPSWEGRTRDYERRPAEAVLRPRGVVPVTAW